MAIRYFDETGKEQSEAWAHQKYGAFAVEVKADSQMHVVALVERGGDAAQIVSVRDENGAGMNGANIAFYWPDAPLDANAGYYGRCVVGPTNANGDVGFGMGQGAYYFAPGAGPHAVWIHGGDSDLVTGLGMLGGTNHYHLNVVYQKSKDEPEPPIPPDDFETAVLIELRKANYYLEKIATKLEQGWRVVPAYSVEGYSKRPVD